MTPYKLQLKLYLEPSATFAPARFIPVFHDWIKHDTLGELLIDVADYDHVHRGPGVVLIGDAADYSIDLGEGRPGLLLSIKRRAPEPEARLGDLFRRALGAASKLCATPSLAPLAFVTSEALLRINDRLLAPNDDAGHAAHDGEITSYVQRLFGPAAACQREGEARDLFALRLRAPGAPDVATLLAKA